jgi:hypothetical protein
MRAAGSHLLAAAAMSPAGCVNGPLRFSALGDAEYATIDFVEDAPPLLVPVAIIGGAATDLGILLGDTVTLFGTGIAFGPYAWFWWVSKGKVDPWFAYAAPVTIPVCALILVPAAGMIWPAGGDYSLLTGIEPAEGPYSRRREPPPTDGPPRSAPHEPEGED